jgi:hypothetical protein
MHLAQGFFCAFLGDASTSVFDYDNLKPFFSRGERGVFDGVVGCKSRDKYACTFFLTEEFGEGGVLESVVNLFFRLGAFVDDIGVYGNTEVAAKFSAG